MDRRSKKPNSCGNYNAQETCLVKPRIYLHKLVLKNIQNAKKIYKGKEIQMEFNGISVLIIE